MTAEELRGMADFCSRAARLLSRDDQAARMRQMAADYLSRAEELEKQDQPKKK